MQGHLREQFLRLPKALGGGPMLSVTGGTAHHVNVPEQPHQSVHLFTLFDKIARPNAMPIVWMRLA
jgi:hypothetical protein